jgi:hypothetical protein
MYNIHTHYENIFSLAKQIITHPVVVYLHPFGTSNIENIENLSLGIGRKQGPILFCYDQEPLIPGYNEPLFEHVRNTFGKNGRPVILLNTEQNSEAKNYFLSKYNFIDAYSFFHIFAAHDWFRGYKYYPDLTPIQSRTIKKKYITFNRLTGNARCYRSFFVAELQKQNLIGHGYVSYSDNCPEHGHYSNGISFAIQNYNVSPENGSSAKHYLDQIKYPLRIDFKNYDSIPNGSMQISAINECMESFLYVVTETCFWDKKQHLTEKIFKPIITQQPFVLLGCAHNLKYLKQYGFKTFDAWWDESYDSIEDPIERIRAVTDIINNISKKSNEELQQLLIEMKPVLEHNYNLFNGQEFLDNAWIELVNNLKNAINFAYPNGPDPTPAHEYNIK